MGTIDELKELLTKLSDHDIEVLEPSKARLIRWLKEVLDVGGSAPK
jgi:hypothetical protein